ncbi:hypothetical protein LCGC14_2056870 [marine sediment metagenome]|uniref:Uncharacterized protein n=1 Tax=marine sediment metagenome TaxID=412755 RepID=A0A0F9EMF2_9ZZZZ
MNHLPKIIGPAPSELSQEELLAKVRSERSVVSALLIAFRESLVPARGKKTRKSGSPTGPTEQDILTEMKKLGLSMSDLKEAVKVKKGEK